MVAQDQYRDTVQRNKIQTVRFQTKFHWNDEHRIKLRYRMVPYPTVPYRYRVYFFTSKSSRCDTDDLTSPALSIFSILIYG